MSYNSTSAQLALDLVVDTAPLDNAVTELRYHINAMKFFALTLDSSVGRVEGFYKTLALLEPIAELGWRVGTQSNKFRTTTKAEWLAMTSYNPISLPLDERSNETLVNIALDYKMRLEAITIRLRAFLPEVSTKLSEQMDNLVKNHKLLYYTLQNELL